MGLFCFLFYLFFLVDLVGFGVLGILSSYFVLMEFGVVGNMLILLGFWWCLELSLVVWACFAYFV